MKKLILIFSFLIISSGMKIDFYKIDNADFIKIRHSEVLNTITEYTYVRVFKDGIWWIYLYDEDGTLINVYPDVQ